MVISIGEPAAARSQISVGVKLSGVGLAGVAVAARLGVGAPGWLLALGEGVARTGAGVAEPSGFAGAAGLPVSMAPTVAYTWVISRVGVVGILPSPVQPLAPNKARQKRTALNLPQKIHGFMETQGLPLCSASSRFSASARQ